MAVKKRDEQRLARKRRRQEAKQRDILKAARRVLLDEGIEGFTVAAVAAAADVSKPSVYYYFEDKEALISALAVEVFSAEVRAMSEAVARAPTGVDALEGALRAYVTHHLADLDGFRILHIWSQVLRLRGRLLESEVYPRSAEFFGELSRKLEADRAVGRLHPAAHPRRLANVGLMLGHGLVSLISGLRSVGGSTRYPVQELLEEAVDTLRRGTLR